MTSTIHVNGHVLTILHSFLAVVVRRVPLPRYWWTIFVSPEYAIDQSRIDVEVLDPNFEMATLICFLETQHAVRDSKGSMHTDLPFVFGTRRFFKPTYIRLFIWPLFNTADGPSSNHVVRHSCLRY